MAYDQNKDPMSIGIYEAMDILVRNGEGYMWPVVRATDLFRLYNTKNPHEKFVNRIAERILDCADFVVASTILCGHESMDPTSLFPKEEVHRWANYAYYMALLTDTGIDRMSRHLDVLRSFSSVGEKLAAIDFILQVNHMRDDLQLMFVEGGWDTIDSIREGCYEHVGP